MASTSLALVEWTGDAKPDCWQIIKVDKFLKPNEVKEGKTLDAFGNLAKKQVLQRS